VSNLSPSLGFLAWPAQRTFPYPSASPLPAASPGGQRAQPAEGSTQQQLPALAGNRAHVPNLHLPPLTPARIISEVE